MADTSRLVVLGTCGAWPEAGRACSGYLLEHEGFRVLLDLGYGALPRLLEALGSGAADGLGPGVAELGRDADLFIVEATNHSQLDQEAADEPGTHLAAAHTAQVVAASGARRALLTHFWPGTDREATRAAVQRALAEQGYDGEVVVATEGLELSLP